MTGATTAVPVAREATGPPSLSVVAVDSADPLTVVLDIVFDAGITRAGRRGWVQYRPNSSRCRRSCSIRSTSALVAAGLTEQVVTLVGPLSAAAFRLVALITEDPAGVGGAGDIAAPTLTYTPDRGLVLDWPTADDVRKMLRAEGFSADDDDVLAWSLDAAIGWIRGRASRRRSPTTHRGAGDRSRRLAGDRARSVPALPPARLARRDASGGAMPGLVQASACTTPTSSTCSGTGSSSRYELVTLAVRSGAGRDDPFGRHERDEVGL